MLSSKPVKQTLAQRALGLAAAMACCAASGSVDPASGLCRDAGFGVQLQAADCSLALSREGNEPWSLTPSDGTERTGARAMILENVPVSVPEPGSALLALVAGLALTASGRRKIIKA